MYVGKNQLRAERGLQGQVLYLSVVTCQVGVCEIRTTYTTLLHRKLILVYCIQSIQIATSHLTTWIAPQCCCPNPWRFSTTNQWQCPSLEWVQPYCLIEWQRTLTHLLMLAKSQIQNSTQLKGEVARSHVLALSGRGGEFTQPSLHLLAWYCIWKWTKIDLISP